MPETKKLFIHIGAHKTGTTCMQAKIFPDLSIHYSRAVSSQLRYFVDGMNGVKTNNISDINVVKDYVNRCEGNVLLSHESLMGHFKNDYANFKDNIAVIKEHFPNAELIFVTRDSIPWKKSIYKESVYTQSETRSLKNAEIGFDLFEAAEYLKNNITVHVLEYELFVNDPILFLTKLEKITNSKFYGVHDEVVRKSMSSIQTVVARFANLFGISKNKKKYIKKLLP